MSVPQFSSAGGEVVIGYSFSCANYSHTPVNAGSVLMYMLYDQTSRTWTEGIITTKNSGPATNSVFLLEIPQEDTAHTYKLYIFEVGNKDSNSFFYGPQMVIDTVYVVNSDEVYKDIYEGNVLTDEYLGAVDIMTDDAKIDFVTFRGETKDFNGADSITFNNGGDTLVVNKDGSFTFTGKTGPNEQFSYQLVDKDGDSSEPAYVTLGWAKTDIVMGDSNDSLHIDGTEAIQWESIDLGAGNDVLLFTNANFDGTGVTLDGGENNAIKQAAANDSTAHLGDILGLNGTNLVNFHKVTSAGDIQNFEALKVDLVDQSSSSLDDLLEGFKELQTNQGTNYGVNDNNHMQSLVVTNNSGNINLGLDASQLQHTGISIDGLNGVYDHYVVSYGSDEINLYVLVNHG
jgi:hypothetical protein